MDKPKVGFNTAYSVVIANMIGVGVFTSLGFQLVGLESYISITTLWLFGGFLALNGSFCYMELSAAYPRSGGEYHFLRTAFGDQVGFLSGWASSIVGFAAPIAASAYAFSKYFLDVTHWPVHPLFISTFIIVIISVVNCISLAHSAKLQVITSFAKVLLMLLLIAFGFVAIFFIKGDSIGTKHLILGDFKKEFLAPAFWVSLIYVSYAYSGWNASSYIIDDIENPKKTVPRSILLGVLTVIVIYTLINFVFLLSSAAAEMVGKEDFVFFAANNLFSSYGGSLISFLIAFFLMSTISALILVGPRVIHAISKDYPFFSFFVKYNKNGLPIRSIVTQGMISITILVTSSFEFIITTMGLILCFFTTLTAISTIVLRYKHPNLERPIKMPLYPLPPIIYAVFNLWIMYHVVTSKPEQAIYSIVFILLGAIIYYFAKNNRKTFIIFKR
jgi:APA family basic amino acid/polyamine antiporter